QFPKRFTSTASAFNRNCPTSSCSPEHTLVRKVEIYSCAALRTEFYPGRRLSPTVRIFHPASALSIERSLLEHSQGKSALSIQYESFQSSRARHQFLTRTLKLMTRPAAVTIITGHCN